MTASAERLDNFVDANLSNLVPDGADGSSGDVHLIQEKVNEFKVLVAPVEQAIRELQFARGMLRARAEDEINALSPALTALSEALNISTLDLLTAADRSQFLSDAVVRAGIPAGEVRRRLMAAGDGTGDPLQLLGLRADAH